jgi:hypothetical protein
MYGNIVCIIPFGSTDWIGIFKSVNKRDFLRYISYLAETRMFEMNSSGPARTCMNYQTFVIDFEFLSMRQMAYKTSEPQNTLFFN